MTSSNHFWCLGLDPGFANFGWALCRVYADGQIEPYKLGLIQTQKASGKVPVIEDMLRRGRQVVRELRALEVPHAETGEMVQALSCIPIVACEGLSYPTSKSSTAKLCVSWGCLLGCLDENTAMVQRRPQDIKQATTGAQSASKKEVEWALMDPNGKFKMTEIESLLKAAKATALKKREHPIDAIGAVVAAQNDETMRMLRRMIA